VRLHKIKRGPEAEGDCILKHKLIIDGNAVYEIDDDCLACLQAEEQWEEKREAETRNGERRLSYPPYGKTEKSREK
jgi:hypothetical protein